jgi:hypothetical protein
MNIELWLLKLYLLTIDKGNRRSHLPTLFICTLIAAISVMLLVKMPEHTSFKAHSVTDFLLTFGKSLAWLQGTWIS